MMTRILLFLFSVILAYAVVIEPESAKQRAARERAERAWAKSVLERYEAASLMRFLKVTIQKTRVWQGVDLTKPTIGMDWRLVPGAMVSEEWSFTTIDPK